MSPFLDKKDYYYKKKYADTIRFSDDNWNPHTSHSLNGSTLIPLSTDSMLSSYVTIDSSHLIDKNTTI